jgi:Starch-binding associating with outer membrane
MKKILMLLLTTTLFFACQKDFGDLNVDTKKPPTVEPSALFVYSQKELSDLMATPNVNTNIFRLLSQYWTETTYTDEANYDLTTRNIPQNFWNTMYVSVLNNLKESQRLIPSQNPVFFPAAVQKNQNACAEILNVYAFSTLVNTFGNVPYTDALNIDNVYPKYDDAATIYDALLVRLDKAITDIDVNSEGFGGNDLYFGGDMAGWKTFANSLKLRMGMTLADVNPAKAKTVVESAAPGAISSNDENVAFGYLSAPPNTNPVWEDLVQSGRKDFVGANTIVDAMNGLNDPRVPLFFTTDADGNYSGGIYAASNNYSTYSKPSDALTDPTLPGVLIDYAEVRFLLAEATARGFSVGGTPEAHYEAAIRASIEYWGGSNADADTYLAQPSVAYATATGDWKQKIGTQKWIALYNRGFDGWVEWRRFDYPILNVPDGLTYGDIPVRYTYPIQEQTLNSENYTRGSASVGGDEVTTKLFWDVQ